MELLKKSSYPHFFYFLFFIANASLAQSEGPTIDYNEVPFENEVSYQFDLISSNSQGSLESVEGERFDSLSGQMNYYSRDFYFEGNGLPIEIGRRLQTDRALNYRFGQMSLEIPRLVVNKPFSRYQDPDDQYRHDDTAHGVQGNINQTMATMSLYVGEQTINFYIKDLGNSVTSRYPAAARLISPDNWYVAYEGNLYVAYSPEGVRYKFGTSETIAGGLPFTKRYQGLHAFYYVSEMSDKFGNKLTYNYSDGRDLTYGSTTQNAYSTTQLNSIVSSDGRAVSLAYDHLG